jgi:flagellar biosynthetic protein FlhB
VSDENDRESKTEEATEKRLRDSEAEGRVPHSREVVTAFSVGAIHVLVVWQFAGMAAHLGTVLSIYLDRADTIPLANGADLQSLLLHVGRHDFALLFVPLLVLALAGVSASVLQNRPRAIAKRIQPKFSNISPGAGFRRLYSLTGGVEFAKSAGKLVACTIAIAVALADAPAILVRAEATPLEVFGATLVELARSVTGSVLVVTAVIAAADLAWSRFRYRRDLRMTRQEIKDEVKDAEGDPLLKARMKSVARDRSRRKMLQAVPTATLIVTNPTHFAVALRYRRGVDNAPVVVAKGMDHLALKIRTIAGDNGVRLFENPPLARALYREAPLGYAVPEQFFEAIAALVVLAERHASQARIPSQG